MTKGRAPVLRLDGLHERDTFVASFDESDADLGIALFDRLERERARVPLASERHHTRHGRNVPMNIATKRPLRMPCRLGHG